MEEHNREPPIVNERVSVEQPFENYTRVANEILYAGMKVKGRDYTSFPPLSQKALMVFIALRSFDHSRGMQGYVCPGLGLISAVARVSRSSAQRALTELEEIGLLVKQSGMRKGGSNAYIVRWTFPRAIQEGHSDLTRVIQEGHSDLGQVRVTWGRSQGPGGVGHSDHRRRPLKEDVTEKTKEEDEEGRQLTLTPPAPPPSDPIVMTFTGLTRTAGVDHWHLRQSHYDALKEGYEGIDLDRELRIAKVKIATKACRQPKPTGMPRFLTNWLGKARIVEQPSRQSAAEPRREGKRPDESWDEYEVRRAREGSATMQLYAELEASRREAPVRAPQMDAEAEAVSEDARRRQALRRGPSAPQRLSDSMEGYFDVD